MKSNMFKTWKGNHKTKIIAAKPIFQAKKSVWGLTKCNQFQSKENFEVVEKDQDLRAASCWIET